jgi:hypothetical protein
MIVPGSGTPALPASCAAYEFFHRIAGNGCKEQNPGAVGVKPAKNRCCAFGLLRPRQ